MTKIEKALESAVDTKACEIGPGAVDSAGAMFRAIFPSAKRAIVVDDPRTGKAAGRRALAKLAEAGIETAEYIVGAGGEDFHATYERVEEVREAIRAANGAVPVAVGSGTINDLVKRSSEELDMRYMVVGTAASMDGYTAYGAAITKDGMKQTLSCRAPLGCIVDSAVAAAAPRDMTASGYADLMAKIPAGADWMLADAIGSEAIHPLAWKLVQDSLKDALANPAGCASGDECEVRKLCDGLVMSGFAMQAMGSSRPASGTEHQVSHYWDMEDLCFNGKPVSHGFKVGIGTIASTRTLELILKQPFANLDIDGVAGRWWKSFDEVKATFPAVFGARPAHILRAELEYAKKFPSRDELRVQLEKLKAVWPELAPRIRSQLMPLDEVREKLHLAGAPVHPEEIGVSPERFRETFRGVPYMRSRYFGLDLALELGLMEELVRAIV